MDAFDKDMALFDDIFPQEPPKESLQVLFKNENDALFDDVFDTAQTPQTQILITHHTRLPFEGYSNYTYPVILTDE